MVAATVVVAEAADLRLARAKLAVIETRNAAEEAVRVVAVARLAAFDALTAETAAQAACNAASVARSRASDEVGDGAAFQGFTSVTLMDNDNNDIVDDRLARLFADNEGNKAIDALFIVAQHDGGKWADECCLVKDLCCATRVETGLWSSMARVGYGRQKRTLLMWEAYSGRLDRVQWLLARGAPRDARDTWGRTALFCAIVNGHTDIVRALIAAGAGVNIAGDGGWTPLHHASFCGHTDTVRALIAAGAGVNIADSYGWTPLHNASRNGHTDIVRALIAAGAGVNIAHQDGWTPIRLAITRDHTDIIRALRDAGAIFTSPA
jgi:hypothetical protein